MRSVKTIREEMKFAQSAIESARACRAEDDDPDNRVSYNGIIARAGDHLAELQQELDQARRKRKK